MNPANSERMYATRSLQSRISRPRISSERVLLFEPFETADLREDSLADGDCITVLANTRGAALFYTRRRRTGGDGFPAAEYLRGWDARYRGTMLGLGYVYTCVFGKNELAPPPPLKKRKFMERRVDDDASSNLTETKKVRAQCEKELEVCDERIRKEIESHSNNMRKEIERHTNNMSLLNKQRTGCVANLDEADKNVADVKIELDIATRFAEEMTRRRRLCDATAAGSSAPALSGAKITLVEDGTAADKPAVPES